MVIEHWLSGHGEVNMKTDWKWDTRRLYEMSEMVYLLIGRWVKGYIH